MLDILCEFDTPTLHNRALSALYNGSLLMMIEGEMHDSAAPSLLAASIPIPFPLLDKCGDKVLGAMMLMVVPGTE